MSFIHIQLQLLLPPLSMFPEHPINLSTSLNPTPSIIDVNNLHLSHPTTFTVLFTTLLLVLLVLPIGVCVAMCFARCRWSIGSLMGQAKLRGDEKCVGLMRDVEKGLKLINDSDSGGNFDEDCDNDGSRDRNGVGEERIALERKAEIQSI